MAPDVLDRISVRDYIVAVEIGAFQAERDLVQRLKFNVVVEVFPLDGDAADDVDRILSYDRVTEAIEFELAAERLNLLETLAERVADRILREPQASRVFVRIEKLDRGTGDLGVEIVRIRGASPAQVDADSAVAPIVVHFSQEALAAGTFPAWLDRFAREPTPVVVTVSGALLDGALEDETPAQQHIALLEVAQNAWRLADQDPRCKVVDTWTELDWGLKNGQVSIWAPPKIVFDSVGGPNVCELTSLELSRWFAQALNAAVHWVLATPSDVSGDIPVEWHDPSAPPR